MPVLRCSRVKSVIKIPVFASFFISKENVFSDLLCILEGKKRKENTQYSPVLFIHWCLLRRNEERIVSPVYTAML